MLGQLDQRLSEARRDIEERRHLRSCLKEAVNDIRRYRRIVKQAEKEAAAFDAPKLAREPQGVAAHLKRRVAAGVLDTVLGERDALREKTQEAADVDSRWSELLAEREKRLAALPEALLERLSEVEERHGVLLGQINVAALVRESGTAALNGLDALYAVIEDPELVPDALTTAQTRILSFRREVKHMHFDTVRLDDELNRILAFSDAVAEAWARETTLERPLRETRQLVRGAIETIEGLMRAASQFVATRRRSVDALESQSDAVTVPA